MTTDLFLHIPKTAGTTVAAIGAKHYAPEETFYVFFEDGHRAIDLALLPQAARDKLRFVTGHFSYGLHALFQGQCRYVTMLRHPVDLVVSNYFYIQRYPEALEHEWLVRWHVTLEDFIAHEQMTNMQVRYLSGNMGGQTTYDDLRLARKRLEEFAAFGLVERFDESMGMFQRALGWRDLQCERRNVFHRPEDAGAVTPIVRSLVEQHHGLSVELYEWAAALFEERNRRVVSHDR